MDIKDLPEKVEKDWTNPEIPEGRHLSADIIPFSEFLAMRKRIGGRNALLPQASLSHEDLEGVKAHEIMQAIEDDFVFSTLTMEPDSILFLEEAIEMFKPQKILELGTGLSTLILAEKQRQKTGKNDSFVTIDQHPEHRETMMDLAKQAGVDDCIQSYLFEMSLYKIGDGLSLEEEALLCYDLNEEKLHDILGGGRPDMIIIDGPVDPRTQYAASLSKTLTLPILSHYAAPGAVFVMDGAYVDTDIFAMEQWQESGTANIIGIKAVGKGMMVAVGK